MEKTENIISESAFREGMHRIQMAFREPIKRNEAEFYLTVLIKNGITDWDWFMAVDRIIEMPLYKIPSLGVMLREAMLIKEKRLRDQAEKERREANVEAETKRVPYETVKNRWLDPILRGTKPEEKKEHVEHDGSATWRP